MIFEGIAEMGIVAEILNLRRKQTSSVATLLALLEWQKTAKAYEHTLSRGFAVTEAVDIVLLNVAAHAAEALGEWPNAHGTRRTLPSFRRNRRRTDSGQLRQHRLFAF